MTQRKHLDELEPAAREYYHRQMQLIINEMPIGTHRMRAEAWRALARRCNEAAELHDKSARQLEAERVEDNGVWQGVEQAKRFVRSQVDRSRVIAEAMLADALAPTERAPAPGDLVALTDDGEALLVREPHAGVFTDADGNVHRVEFDIEIAPGYEGDPDPSRFD